MGRKEEREAEQKLWEQAAEWKAKQKPTKPSVDTSSILGGTTHKEGKAARQRKGR